MQEKEEALTSLLQEAKIISQESDQLEVTALIVSRCAENLVFRDNDGDDDDDVDDGAKPLFKHLMCAAFEKCVYQNQL